MIASADPTRGQAEEPTELAKLERPSAEAARLDEIIRASAGERG